MKYSRFKLFFCCIMLMLVSRGNAQTANSDWKHYEVEELNIMFDFPPDFVFRYDEAETYTFFGSNSLGAIYLCYLDEPVSGFDQRRDKLYEKAGLSTDTNDNSFHSGRIPDGYIMVSTKVGLEDNETSDIYILSDPNNNKLNFFVCFFYYGADKTDSYEQAQSIFKNIKPIKK